MAFRLKNSRLALSLSGMSDIPLNHSSLTNPIALFNYLHLPASQTDNEFSASLHKIPPSRRLFLRQPIFALRFLQGFPHRFLNRGHIFLAISGPPGELVAG